MDYFGKLVVVTPVLWCITVVLNEGSSLKVLTNYLIACLSIAAGRKMSLFNATSI